MTEREQAEKHYRELLQAIRDRAVLTVRLEAVAEKAMKTHAAQERLFAAYSALQRLVRTSAASAEVREAVAMLGIEIADVRSASRSARDSARHAQEPLPS